MHIFGNIRATSDSSWPDQQCFVCPHHINDTCTCSTTTVVVVVAAADADDDTDDNGDDDNVGDWAKADGVPLSWRMKQYEAMLDSLDRTKTVLAIFPSRFIHAGPSEVH